MDEERLMTGVIQLNDFVNKPSMKISSLAAAILMAADLDHLYMPKSKVVPGTRVDVRTEPKINRNSVCPKCKSGKKFKMCCGRK